MMQNQSQASRWGLNVIAFVILLPVLLDVQLDVQLVRVVTPEYIQMMAKGGHWLGLPAVILMIALYATSFVLVLWKGRLRLAILVAFINCILVLFSPLVLLASGDTGPRRLVIHEITPGIDVFCNDVYLGKTPLKISETEFHEKVKPWATPPRQKMVIGEEFITQNIPQQRYGLANTEFRCFYIPYDHFDRYRTFGQSGFSSDFPSLKSNYWWRFERDGCTGGAAIGNVVLGEYYDGRLFRAQWWSPSLEYPSIRPYLAHLLHNLQRSNYQPSTEWRTHVADASGLLFRHLYEVGKRDSRVMRALEMAIQTEFGIYGKVPAEAWEAALNEIMSRVKHRRSFHASSPESMAMDLIIQHNPKLIEAYFLKLLSRTMDPWRVFTSGLNRSMTYGDPAEFLPLEYAVLKSCPPTLFKRLVYESGRGERFLSMVGNYSREESLRLVRHYLDKGISNRPTMYYGIHSQPQQKALSFASHLQNSALELELRRFVLQQAQPDSRHTNHHLREFIDTRLERHLTEDDAISLAEWVAEAVPLPEDEKLQYLIRINSDRTHRYVRDILQRQPLLRPTVLEDLIRHPNPSLDLFLIEAYQAESTNMKSGEIVPITMPRKNLGVSPNLIRAMVLCDTPRMRAFLEQIWSTSDHSKIALLEAIKQEASNHYPHFHRWTTLISEIEDANTRLAAILALDEIDTPESSEVLANWALSSDEAVKEEAARAFAKYRERSRKAEALLAGTIKPDDLLVGHTAYVWDGKNYVPEETTSKDK